MPLWRGCGLRVGLDEQREHLAVDAVGDPGLGAVDEVGVVARAHGAGADRLQVGAAVGLGQRQPAAQLAGGEARQPGALLLLGADALDAGRHDQVRVEDAGQRHPHLRHPLHDARVGGGRQPEPAVGRADGGAEQAQRLHLLHHVRGVDVVVLQRAHVRAHVPLQPLADRVEDRGFVFAGGGRRGCRHGLPSVIIRCARQGAIQASAALRRSARWNGAMRSAY